MARRYHKKAQGLSLNTIIIAAIGLAVLVILFAVFTGRIGGFNKGLDTAQNEFRSCDSVCKTAGYTGGNTLQTNTESCSADTQRVAGGEFGCCCAT